MFEAACRLGALTAADGLGTHSRTRLARSRDGSGWPSRCWTTCSTSPDRWSGPASHAARTCSTAPSRSRSSSRANATPELATFDLASLQEDGHPHVEALCERIAATGALEQAREQALAIVAEAKAALPAILPNGRSTLLGLVADAVVERYR